MNAHQNAKTTLHIRELIVARRHEGWSASEIAEALDVSVRTVFKWLRRFREAGRAGLLDGPCAASRLANRLANPLIEKIASLRRERMTGARAPAQAAALDRGGLAQAPWDGASVAHRAEAARGAT